MTETGFHVVFKKLDEIVESDPEAREVSEASTLLQRELVELDELRRLSLDFSDVDELTFTST